MFIAALPDISGNTIDAFYVNFFTKMKQLINPITGFIVVLDWHAVAIYIHTGLYNANGVIYFYSTSYTNGAANYTVAIDSNNIVYKKAI